MTLDADSVEPVLHAYGTTGILADVTMRLVPACEWVELVITFADFDRAATFVTELNAQADLRIRVASAQETQLTPAFTALSGIVQQDDSLVLLIIEEDDFGTAEQLAAAGGGQITVWKGFGAEHRPTLDYMVYGHRMLWVKKFAPGGAFLNCYLDPTEPLAHLRAFKTAMGDEILVELKYLRSQWMRERYGHTGPGLLPAPLVCVVNGSDRLADVLACCDDLGIQYQNPHAFALEKQGLFADPSVLHRFKAKVDPKGLLNPGKLSASDERNEAGS